MRSAYAIGWLVNWIADRLQMGSWTYGSNLLREKQ
jgi:hypothetical protein